MDAVGVAAPFGLPAIGFGLVASLLTLGGLYGVLSLSVASRSRELAIRSAVGARRRDVMNLVLGEGMKLTGIAVVLGLTAGNLLSRGLRSFLFEVGPGDPVTLGLTAALFVVVALIACWAPAQKAGRLNPLEAL